MSDDLIERLRTITSSGCNTYSACHEAAAELSRLRAEVERLTADLSAVAEARDMMGRLWEKAEAALSDERRHADALAEAVEAMDLCNRLDCEMRDNVLREHRARRQG